MPKKNTEHRKNRRIPKTNIKILKIIEKEKIRKNS